MRQSTMYRRAEKDSAVHGSGIHPEDQQPNESINKRQRTAPSIASTSVPLLRQGNNAWNRPGTTSGSRGGSHYSERNRDGWAQQAGSGMPRRGSYDRGGRGRDHFQQFSPQQHSTLDAYQISRFQTMHSRPNHRNAAHELNPIACTESSDQALCHTEESHPTTQASTSSEYQVSTICESVSPDIISLSENHPIARVPRVKTQEYIARVSTPPLKRRRLDQVPQAAVKSEEAEDQEQLTLTPNSRAHPPPSVIKSETRSPSPPSRRLVTESCSLYPIPDNCRKANPNPNPAYLKNRHALIAKESRYLKRLGLKPKNVLFRDDGMVIEWTSSVPVWSDTLLPESSKISSTSTTREISVSKGNKNTSQSGNDEGQESDGSSSSSVALMERRLPPGDSPLTGSAPITRLPLPRRRSRSPRVIDPPVDPAHLTQLSSPSIGKDPPKPATYIPLARRKIPVPEDPPTPTIDNSPKIVPTPEHEFIAPGVGYETADGGPADAPSNSGTTQHQPDNVWSADELSEVEPMAVAFLQSYIKAFDTDRSTLRRAYSDTAMFSCRMPIPAVPAAFPRVISYKISEGPSQIVDALVSIGSYKFCDGSSTCNFYYDVVSLSREVGGGILLAVHNEVVDLSHTPSKPLVHPRLRDQSSVVLIDQSFVLHRNSGGENGMVVSSDTALWPLVAVSHQMVMRPSTGFGIEHLSLDSPKFPWLA